MMCFKVSHMAKTKAQAVWLWTQKMSIQRKRKAKEGSELKGERANEVILD